MSMPQLIYGTAWKKDKTAELVTLALSRGFRGIDTACQPKHYNEAGVGEAIQRALSKGVERKDLYIQTKFTPINGQDPFSIPYDRGAPLNEQVAQSFEVSKKNLGVSYVDGLILHSPLENFDRTMIVWQAFELIYNQGGTKQIGISNCYDLRFLKLLFEAAVIQPTIIQNRFYQETAYDHDIREWCQNNKIVYQSFWTLTANPHLLSSNEVQKAAQTHKKTPAQIIFRVLIDNGIVPLTGTCSDNHMQEDLEVLQFSLPNTTVQEITSLFSN